MSTATTKGKPRPCEVHSLQWITLAMGGRVRPHSTPCQADDCTAAAAAETATLRAAGAVRVPQQNRAECPHVAPYLQQHPSTVRPGARDGRARLRRCTVRPGVGVGQSPLVRNQGARRGISAGRRVSRSNQHYRFQQEEAIRSMRTMHIHHSFNASTRSMDARARFPAEVFAVTWLLRPETKAYQEILETLLQSK
jgi:hypothetical protein